MKPLEQIHVRRRPTRILRTHIDLIEVLVETTVIFTIEAHHVTRHPLRDFQNGELVTQTALAVTVHNIRDSVRRKDFIDSRTVELFTGFRK